MSVAKRKEFGNIASYMVLLMNQMGEVYQADTQVLVSFPAFYEGEIMKKRLDLR
jgi:hypothetical protein